MWAGDYAQELSANKLLATLVFAVCIHTLQTAKPAEASADAAYPPRPPRRAHDTLQPQDESIIVSYYTSAEVLPEATRSAQSEIRR